MRAEKTKLSRVYMYIYMTEVFIFRHLKDLEFAIVFHAAELRPSSCFILRVIFYIKRL